MFHVKHYKIKWGYVMTLYMGNAVWIDFINNLGENLGEHENITVKPDTIGVFGEHDNLNEFHCLMIYINESIYYDEKSRSVLEYINEMDVIA